MEILKDKLPITNIPNTYEATYICPLCKCILRYSDQFRANSKDIFPLVCNDLGKEPDKRSFPQFVQHLCDDGSVGVSQFSGIKKIL